MLFTDIRSQLEGSKNAVRNYIDTIFEKEDITAKESISILNNCKEVSSQLAAMDIPEGDLKMKEELNILSIDNVFNIVDHYIEINFNHLNISKIIEDFIYARKESESKANSKVKEEDHHSNEEAENPEEEQISEEDIQNAIDEFLTGLKEKLSEMFKCKKDEINLDEKISDDFIRSLIKVRKDEKEQLKPIFINSIVSGVNTIIKNTTPKINEFLKQKEEDQKDKVEDKSTIEEAKNNPLIYEDNIDLMNALDVAMSPLNFNNKTQCREYIDKKISIYKNLIDRFDLSKEKISKIKELNLPIKVNENSNEDSILKEIETYKNDTKNTAPQLREFCINLAKLEDVIFYS